MADSVCHVCMYTTREMEQFHVTAVVFASPNIRIAHDEDADQRRVEAAGDIARGDLLLVEELVGGDPQFLTCAVAADRGLFSILHPRRADDSSAALATSVIVQRAREKLGKNQWDEDPPFVGKHASAFNHHCSPNAIFCIIPIDSGGGIGTVYAAEDIAAGKEVTVSYGPDVGHGNPAFAEIVCGDPGCTEERRSEHFRAMSDLVNAWLEADVQGVKSEMLPAYADSDVGKDVHDSHMCCRRILRKRRRRQH